MPTESPNTILLSQILDDLDQLINSQSEDNKNSGKEKEITVKIDGNDDVVSLLTGLGVLSKEDKDVEKTSLQVENLINIVDKLSKITPKKAEAAISAAEAISKLADAFSKIKIEKKDVDGLSEAADFILKLSSIKPANIKSLTAISAMLTPEIATQIANFIKAFKIEKKELDGVTQALTSLYTVLSILNTIDINKLLSLITALGKLDGGTGKKVSEFLSEVSKVGSKEKPSNLKLSNSNMKMIAMNIAIFIGCIGALALLAMFNLKATLIGVGLAILVLATVIGAVWALSKIKKPIVAGLDGLKSIAILIAVLTGVIIALSIMAKIDFNALVTGVIAAFAVLAMVVGATLLLAKYKKTTLVGLEGLKEVGKLILILVATIGVMMILAAIDLKGLLVATGITLGILFAIVGFVALLSLVKSVIKPGISAIKGLGESIVWIVAAIGIMMLLMAIDMGGVLKATGLVLLIVLAVVAIVRFVGGTGKDVKRGTTNMKGIGLFLIMMVAAIGIMMLIIKYGDTASILGAIGIVIGVTIAMVLMIKWLASTDPKNLRQANFAMMTIAIVILVISIIALTVFIPISELLKPVLIGAAVVLGIVLVMVGLVFLITLMKKDQLMEGVLSLAILAGIVLVISLVAKFLLIPIGQEWKDAAIGGAVVMAIIGLMVAAVWAITAMNKEKLMEGVLSLAILAGIVLVISLVAKFLLIPIGQEWKDAAIGGAVVMIIIGLMVAYVYAITKMDKAKIIEGVVALGILAVIVLIVALVARYLLIPIGKEGKDAAIGGAIVLAIVYLMAQILKDVVKITDKYKMSKLLEAEAALGIMALIVAAVALIAEYQFIPIGKEGKDAAIGGAIVLSIVYLINKILKDVVKITDKYKMSKLLEAEAALGIMALIVEAITLITQYQFIPIGKEGKNAAIGGAVVLAATLGISKILQQLIKITDKYKMSKLLEAEAALGIMTAIVEAITLIAQHQFIPIGARGKDAAIGGAVVLAATLGISKIMQLVIKITKKYSLAQLGKAEAALGAMAGIMGAVAYIAKTHFIPIGKKGKDAAAGGAVVLATLIVMAKILQKVGEIADKNERALIEGGVVLAAIAGLLWIIGELMPSWIDTCTKANKHKKDMALGGAAIVATLVAMGVLATTIGSLTFILPLIAIGEVILGSIALVANAIANMMPAWINACNLVVKNKKNLEKGNKIMPDILNGMTEWIMDFSIIRPDKVASLMAGIPTAETCKKVLLAINMALIYYVGIVNSFNALNKSMLKNFIKFVTDEKSGFVGSIMLIVDKLSEVGVYSAAKASIIAILLKPIFSTIGDFMDVVLKFANMKYVSEWDKDGKPVAYESITPEMFKKAANAISSSFALFLTLLGLAMKSWDVKSLLILTLMKDSLGPVMTSVATFTNAIISAISALIPCEWDKDGKPIKYRQFNPLEFGVAATIISNGFANFLDTLGPALLNMPISALFVINLLKEGIEPVLNAVATYSDTVMLFVAGKEVEYTDDEGNTVKKLIDIDPVKFGEAGTHIATAFTNFLSALGENLGKYAYGGEKIETEESGIFFKDHKYEESQHGNKVSDIIAGMTGLKEVIDGVEALVNVIAKTCTDLADVDLSTAVDNVTTPVVKFINALCNSFGTDEQIKKVENVNGGLDKLKTLATKFSENIALLHDSYLKYNVDSEKVTALMLEFVEYVNKLNTLPDLSNAKKNGDLICNVIKGFAEALKKYEEVTLKNDLSIIYDAGDLISHSYESMGDALENYMKRFARFNELIKPEYEKKYKPTVTDAININKSLYDTFVKLDTELISKRKERNQALVELKDNIGAVANQIHQVSEGLKLAAENYNSFKDAERELDNVRAQQTNETIVNNTNNTTTTGDKTTTNTQKTTKETKPKDPTEALILKYAKEFANQFASMFRSFLQQERSVLIFNSSNQLERQAKMKVQ